MPNAELSAPLRYFPIENGLYEVAAGLRRAETLANAHGFAIWLDCEFPIYRENKIACRNEALERYAQWRDFDEAAECAVGRLLIDRLIKEWPRHFAFSAERNGGVAYAVDRIAAWFEGGNADAV